MASVVQTVTCDDAMCLCAGPYLLVITRREKVGEVDQRTIWKVTGTEVISYQRTLLHLNEQQVCTGDWCNIVVVVAAAAAWSGC